MSGQQIFTLAGQVIGGAIGGPIGAAIGGALGSVIGGALFNQDQTFEGQRLTDLRVQNSSTGQAIPLIYGSARVAGNLIWASEMRETAIEEDLSEAESGGPSVTQINYSYDIDVAIAVCEGTIVGVERIFGNGVLLFDARAGVDAATVFAGGQWATGIYTYTGTEDQLPDPTIEAAVGVGNAQGYRGTAYIVITGLQLNTLKTAAIPNFEFVVIQSGTPSQYSQKFVVDGMDPPFRTNTHATRAQPHVSVSQGVVRVFGTKAHEDYPDVPLGSAFLFDLNGNEVGENDLTDSEGLWPVHHTDLYSNIVADAPGDIVNVTGPAITIPLLAGSVSTMEGLARIVDEAHAKVRILYSTLGSIDTAIGIWQQRCGGFEVVSVDQSEDEPSITVLYPEATSGTLGVYGIDFDRWAYAPGMYAYTGGYGHNIVDLDLGGGQLASHLIPPGGSPFRIFLGFVLCADRSTIVALIEENYGDISGGSYWADTWVRLRRTDDGFYVADDVGTVSQVPGERIEYFYNGAPSSIGDNFTAGAGEADARWLWLVTGGGYGDVNAIHIDDDGVMRIKHRFWFGGDGDGLVDGGWTEGSSYPAAYADGGLIYIVVDDALFCYSREGEIFGDGIPLSEVVADICDRSDIDASELDVTALTPIVRGYTCGQMMTGRQAIESLRPIYYFDAVDGDKLKFVMRGGASVADFLYNDIGVEEEPQRVANEFTQETERPARVNVRYIAQGADYQLGAQSARRETTSSRETLELEAPIVLSDDEAAQAADVNLRDAWAASAKRSWKSSTKYSHIEPTDVVTVDDGTVVRTVRVISRLDRGLLIEWEGFDEDAATYDSNATGAAILPPEQTIAVTGPTDIEVLDLPPLTDLRSGNESANYYAARGFLTGWTAAVVEISRDEGVTYSKASTVSAASIMGVAKTELGDFLGGNVFDEANVVRVWASDTLVSITAAEVMDGGNPCVIGDEILQFRDATLVDANIYDLSGLLRGRKGTEWAIGTHEVGDRFVKLSTNLRNIPAVTTDRYSESLRVRAISAGASAAAAESESFTTQLARLMPYSPAHLSGVKTPYGSWTLTWVRRDRYHNDWNDGSDVPMSEETLRYDVEVYDGDEIAASYSDLTSETVPVPSSVLGSGASEITFSVWQKSTIVGRGFEANATIIGASGVGEWRQSTDTTYLSFVKGVLPADLPDPPAALPATFHTYNRLRYTGFVIDLQVSGSTSLAMYEDDADGSQGDHVNIIFRDWSAPHIVKDDGDADYFFASYYASSVSYITRFRAADASVQQWSSYYAGMLGPVTQTTLAGTFFPIVSIGANVFAYSAASETIYKYLNSDLSTVTSWAKPASSPAVIFKNSTDLWMGWDDEFRQINQSSGAETLNFNVAGDITDAVAVGGFVYVYIASLDKVKKYELSSGTVQAFEYDYTDSGAALIANMPVLVADGTLLSIGRAYFDPFSLEYTGTIVVLDTTTDTLL